LLFLALLTMAVWPVVTGLVSGFLLADPLIALNSVAHGLFRWEMLLAVPVILSPLFLGRVFCGYVCPTGFLIELLGPRKERHPRGPRGEKARVVLRKVPLFGLVVVVVFILVGSAWFLVMDPISLLTRSATTLLYPAVDRVFTWAGDLLYRAESLQGGVDSVTSFLTGRLIFPNGLHFTLQVLILVMFVAVVAVSWIERRLWCRNLCPLGALLGLVGRGALFGRVVDEDKCTTCGACVKACPMDAIRDGGRSTDMSRCECGLECADACPHGAVRWGYKPRKQFEYDPGRRALLIGAGVALVGTFGLFAGLRRVKRSALPIRPPGSQVEIDFLASCTRCDECLKVCPTNVLQPAVLEAGLEGVFTPRMDFVRGYCEWTCADCGKVCPTQSIRELDLAEKQRTVIGLAVIDRNLCLPWAKGEECLVCEELCPTPRKAIVFGDESGYGTGQGRGGGQGRGMGGGLGSGDAAADTASPVGESDLQAEPETEGVKFPYVLERHCTGCGICQYNCPVQDPVVAVAVKAVEKQTTTVAR
jgi:ferredoxin